MIFFKMFSCMGFRGFFTDSGSRDLHCAEIYVIGGRGEGSKILTRLSGCFLELGVLPLVSSLGVSGI